MQEIEIPVENEIIPQVNNVTYCDVVVENEMIGSKLLSDPINTSTEVATPEQPIESEGT